MKEMIIYTFDYSSMLNLLRGRSHSTQTKGRQVGFLEKSTVFYREGGRRFRKVYVDKIQYFSIRNLRKNQIRRGQSMYLSNKKFQIFALLSQRYFITWVKLIKPLNQPLIFESNEYPFIIQEVGVSPNVYVDKRRGQLNVYACLQGGRQG